MTAPRRCPARGRAARGCRGGGLAFGLAFGLVLGLVLALARPARAQPLAQQPRLVVANVQTRAAQLFQDARLDRDAGAIGLAADKYREALQLWPHPLIHYDLALVLIELRQPVEAAEHLEEVLARGAAVPKPQLEDARKKLHELLEDKIATVMVTCPRQGARVSIDDQHVLTVGMKQSPLRFDMARVVRVRIGWHMFVAQMPGDEADVVVRRYIGRSARTEIIRLEERWEHRRRWEHHAWVPWTVLGGGAMIGLTGGALHWSAQTRYDAIEQQGQACFSPECASIPAGRRTYADTLRAFGLISYGFAGVAVATGGVLMYLNRPIAHRIKNARANAAPGPTPARRRMASLVPLVGPDGGGVMVVGRF